MEKNGFEKASVEKYLDLFRSIQGKEDVAEGVSCLAKKLGDFLEKDAADNLMEIAACVNDTKEAEFDLVFDPTLVRGMSYYTGTIFEIAMPEFGGSCGGGGRYDKMIGKFTGNDVPACGFSIGFERIILLLLESGFQVPGQSERIAYLIEKNYPGEKLAQVIAKAQEQRKAGKQVLVARMNKNKKFQKEKLAAEGYTQIEEFFNRD